MAKKTTVSNEEIIAALLQHGTIKEAAEAAGIAPRTMYDRMHNDDFRREYADARAGVTRAAAAAINSKLSAAIETVTEIMQNPEANPAIRLQAAQTIITNAAKFADRLTADEAHSKAEHKTWVDDLFP